MGIGQAVCNLFVVNAFGWSGSWAWGVPLIILTVVIHVSGLGFVTRRVARLATGVFAREYPRIVFLVAVGTTTLLATGLHAFEAGIWAGAYRYLGALPDYPSAMLYSLSAMTSYGHADLFLESHWRLLGAIEALNGWLLFGLSTAFLFGVIEKVWFSNRREHC